MPTHRTRRLYATLAPTAAALTLAGGLVVATTSGAGGTPATASAAPAHAHASAPAARAVTRQVRLNRAMRTLWDQHMQWTYDAIVAFAADSSALQPTINRLLANQTHIGDAIAPYYGRPAARALTRLLREHITLAVPVLTAAKAGDSAALDTAVANWYRNANRIGAFLATANPRWRKAGMPAMMRTHITQTIAYATQVLKGDHAAAIRTYDRAQAHMNHMADLLADGIVAQFPDRF